MGAPEKKGPAGLVVSAPLVQVITESGAARHLYFGDAVGDDVTKESVDNLKGLGFISDGSKK